jgi:hypothetical protein
MRRKALAAVAAALCAVWTVAAQSTADLPALERKLAAAQAAFSRAEPQLSSSERASLDRELKELQDDLSYLRVKERRGESISERERTDLANRLDRYSSRVGSRDANVGNSGASVPVGTELDVRLQTPLSSRTATVEQRVEATTIVHLYIGDRLLVPAGSLLVGHVAEVDRATRTDRRGGLTLQFTRLTVSGRTHDVRVSVTEALESEGIKGEVGRIGAGSAVGAILGGILGGVKGAVTGVVIGAGGVLVATEGKDVEIPSGQVLRVRFDSAMPLTD